MRWWEQDPARYRDELEAIEARYPSLRLERGEGGERGLCGPIQVGDTTRWIRLCWPDSFPHQRPALYEVEPFGDEPTDLRHTGHQFNDGALCLYTHDAGPDGWRPELRAVDVLDRYVGFRLEHGEDAVGPERGLGVELALEFRIPERITPPSVSMSRETPPLHQSRNRAVSEHWPSCPPSMLDNIRTSPTGSSARPTWQTRATG